MSDLFEVREKTERGAQWRGTISVTIDDEQKELTVRQLRDTEFWEVMSSIDTDELENLQTELPEETMDEYEELQNKDSLTDDERERLDNLQEEVENADVNIFDVLSRDTYEGLKQAAKYGVEPDEADVQTALTQHVNEIEDQYGGTSHEDARQYVQDHVIEPMVERSTDFTSFAIGIRALGETLDSEGN